VSYGAVAQLRRSAGPAGRDLSAPAADEPVAVGLRLLDVLGELQEAGPVVVVLDDAEDVARLPRGRCATASAVTSRSSPVTR
jgi:hypothetical protein